jgi:hypothetical protein
LFLELVNPCSLFVFVDLSQETLRNLGGHCVVCLVLGLLLLNPHPFFFGLGLARTTIVRLPLVIFPAHLHSDSQRYNHRQQQ